jgi:hypothetical protein
MRGEEMERGGDFVGSGSEGVGNVGSGEGLGSEENKVEVSLSNRHEGDEGER